MMVGDSVNWIGAGAVAAGGGAATAAPPPSEGTADTATGCGAGAVSPACSVHLSKMVESDSVLRPG